MEYDFHSAATTLPATRKHDDCPDDFQFHDVTEQDVGKVFKGLSLNKVPGHDKITASDRTVCRPYNQLLHAL